MCRLTFRATRGVICNLVFPRLLRSLRLLVSHPASVGSAVFRAASVERWARPFACVLLAVILCLTPQTQADASPTDTLFVVTHGWHPGIVIPMPLGEPLLLGELEGIDARYVDVGWGDGGYYPNPAPGLWTLLRAAIIPTPSVVQIVAVRGEVTAFAPRAEIVAIPLPDSLKPDLMEYVLGEIHLEDGTAVDEGESLYGRGRFFRATRRYHVFNNSNQWAARALTIVGCDISVWQSLTIELLFAQIRDCGEVVQTREG